MPRMGRMNASQEKSKDFFGSMKRILGSLNRWKYLVLFSLILAFASAIIALISPDKLSDLTDVITEGIKPNMSEEVIGQIMSDPSISQDDKIIFSDFLSKMGEEENPLSKMDDLPKPIYERIKPSIDIESVKSIAILLAILYITSAVLNYVQSYCMTHISNNFARNLRSRISFKINKLPLKYFDTHETGDMLSRITNDVDTIAQNMNSSLASLVTNFTLLFGSIIMMFITNWIMAITAIVSSLLGFVFVALILKNSQKYFTQRQEVLGKMNGHIEEIYSGHNVVKVYNGVKDAKKEFDEINKSLYVCNKKSQFLSGLMGPVMGFVGNLGYVCVCVVGALLTSNNTITFGVIVAFIIYVRMFNNPLSQLAQSTTFLQSTAAAGERVFEFLDEKELSVEDKGFNYLDKDNVSGNIEFKHVKFGYDESKTIIHDFSAKVKAGEKVAIVGPTGAGKTTLVNLLMKFYEISDGDILIDGKSIKSLTRENIHDLFIMVLQDTWLYEGSIRDNLKFNNDVTDKQIWEACDVVGVDHFIKTLSGGLDAQIDNGESISQGQKQLLTIARGMIKNAPFLILDEATSNVDTRTEELVQKAMDELTKGRTSFIIAHRLSTIKNADTILVMKDGNIIEQGSHNSLMKQNGFYAELYNSQFKK